VPDPDRPTSRLVTIVVVHEDEVLGETPPFEVDTPWWQDLEPVSRRYPGLAVLRMLEVRASGPARCGGDVTYLAEPLAADAPLLSSGELRGLSRDVTLIDDPLRMPWACAGVPAADLAWAATKVKVKGVPFQHRSWNLSSIWSMSTDQGEVWLKCIPSFFAHEGAVLRLLEDAPVPRLIASDRHRLLLAAMPGEDGYDATLEQRRRLIDVLAHLQCTTRGRGEEFLAAGVPDRRWPALLRASRSVVERRAPHDQRLQRLLKEAPARIAAIDACGLDDVLAHTDAHAGNARVAADTDDVMWFDWGDSAIGHPMLDVAVLDRPGTPFRDELVAHWLGTWAAAVPGSDPGRAWQLARPLAALLGAVVYQGFLDRIEASERIFHDDDVLPCLARAAAVFEAPDMP
jgi:hypothetical protein